MSSRAKSARRRTMLAAATTPALQHQEVEQVSEKRTGNKWSVNEVLQLQRNYELLELSLQEIAAKHQRSVAGIAFKLVQEGFAGPTSEAAQVVQETKEALRQQKQSSTSTHQPSHRATGANDAFNDAAGEEGRHRGRHLSVAASASATVGSVRRATILKQIATVTARP